MKRVMNNVLMCLFLTKVVTATGPIGRGEGLDCDFEQLVRQVDCSLAQDFKVSFFHVFYFQLLLQLEINTTIESCNKLLNNPFLEVVLQGRVPYFYDEVCDVGTHNTGSGYNKNCIVSRDAVEFRYSEKSECFSGTLETGFDVAIVVYFQSQSS